MPHPEVPRPMGLISPTLASPEGASPWSVLCLTQRCPAQWASSHRHWRRPKVPRPGPDTLCLHPIVPRPMGLISPPTLASPKGASPLVLHAVPHPKLPRPMGLISPTLALPKGASTWVLLVLMPRPRGLTPNGPHLTDTGGARRCPRLVPRHTVPHPRVPRPMGLIY